VTGSAGGCGIDVAGAIVKSCKAQVDHQSEMAIHQQGRNRTVTFKSDKWTHVSLSRAALPAFAALFDSSIVAYVNFLL